MRVSLTLVFWKLPATSVAGTWSPSFCSCGNLNLGNWCKYARSGSCSCSDKPSFVSDGGISLLTSSHGPIAVNSLAWTRLRSQIPSQFLPSTNPLLGSSRSLQFTWSFEASPSELLGFGISWLLAPNLICSSAEWVPLYLPCGLFGELKERIRVGKRYVKQGAALSFSVIRSGAHMKLSVAMCWCSLTS